MGMTDDQLGQGWLFHERFGYAYDKVPPGLAFEAYGKALLMCAAGDGQLTPDERTWVVGYFAAFDSPSEVTDALKSFDGKGDIDMTIAMGDTIANKGRRWLVWDALNACSADGELHADELARVREMAAMVGIEPDVVAQIEQLHQEESAHKKKQYKLLWPEGIPDEYLAGPGKPF